MKIALIAFTREGSRLMIRLKRFLCQRGDLADGFVLSRFYEEFEKDGVVALQEAPSDWIRREAGLWDGFVFVGALGIAARLISPYMVDKATDPAVVVIDEGGSFSIPLYSGHLGGANRLALDLAGEVDAVPVITTATDVRRVFAVDLFASDRNLSISDMGLAKEISGALLDGEEVGFFSDFPVRGNLPEGLVWETEKRLNIRISIYKREGACLTLIPGIVTAGIGCRRGIESDQLRDCLLEITEKEGIYLESIERISSVDIKKDETGLIRLAQLLGVEFITSSPQVLSEVPGEFPESDFVRQTVGVGNVCQRAALVFGGRLMRQMEAKNGVTCALAAGDFIVEF